MEKKRLLISFQNLPNEVLLVIKEKYPYGYNHRVMEIKGMGDKKLHVLPVETADTTYLVKVNFDKPVTIADIEELYDEDDDDNVGSSDELPDEEIVGVDED